MAHSKNKTCLAILRAHLGDWGKENQFAALIHRSTSWVKHASAGLVPLTREMAIQISFETGICPEWLASADISIPPMSANHGEPFDAAYFERYRQSIKASKPSLSDPYIPIATELLPSCFLRIARAIYGFGHSHSGLQDASKDLDSLVQRFELNMGDLAQDRGITGPSEANTRAFSRLALQSSLSQLKVATEVRTKGGAPSLHQNPKRPLPKEDGGNKRVSFGGRKVCRMPT